MSLSAHNFIFFDNCLGYAHCYVSENCNGLWHRCTTPCNWAPNEAIKVYRPVRDWRVRCVCEIGFGDNQRYCKNQFRNNGAPILQCSQVIVDDGSIVFGFSGAFFLICPVEQSYSGKFYSGTACTIKLFISQSVMGIIGVTGRLETDSDNTDHAIDAIGSSVQTSSMSQK